MYIGLHVECQLSLSKFNKTSVFSTYFKKFLNIIFHENPSSGSRVFPCGRTNMRKPTVAFRNVPNAPKKSPLRKEPVRQPTA